MPEEFMDRQTIRRNKQNSKSRIERKLKTYKPVNKDHPSNLRYTRMCIYKDCLRDLLVKGKLMFTL